MSPKEHQIKDRATFEDRPPFFNTWNGLYLFVLAFQIIIIFVFYLFTKYYA